MLVEKTEILDKAERYIELMQGKVNPQYRQQYHLMPPVGWMNDPNGFVYFKGYYHLFYQFHPYDSKWGPMHWGHARSLDLVHWEQLPTALAPDEDYDQEGCFSGSAIEKDGKLFLIYTGCQEVAGVMHQHQCVAMSEDGLHFTKFSANPVVAENELGSAGLISEFRDPKVLYHNDHYYMVVATKTPDSRGRILMFVSEDLLTWQFNSILLEGNQKQGIMWECPDLFHLDGKDVLILSPIQIQKNGLEYFNTSSTMACIGAVDWQTGKMQVDNFHEIDFGMDFYAPQTTTDPTGRRIMVAWMQMWDRTFPTHDLGHGWAGSMTLPRELRVKNNRLLQKPISLVYGQLEYQQGLENIALSETPTVFRKALKAADYIHLVADLSEANYFSLDLLRSKNQALNLNYDVKEELFHVDRHNFGREILGSEIEPVNDRKVKVPLIDGQLVLEIFRDTSSLEVFINGLEVITATFYETEKGEDIAFTADGNSRILAFETATIKNN